MFASFLLLRSARLVLRPIALLSEWLGNRFYLWLAAAVIALSLYVIGAGLTGEMEHQAYDFIMKSRFRAPPADPDIVLVDIDEASLAAMAPEYGRWPWPRSVMAELTEGLARQKPAAIVLDITFSDLDIGRADADRYFRDVAATHPNTYFAMIRLNPANDRLSELKLARLPGVLPLETAQPEATIAMVVPYFLDVVDDRRLGTNNLYADEDGIARSYHVYRDVQGWRVFSLPANVVAALGGTLPERPDILLNWRGEPLVYRTVSFYALYQSLLQQRSIRAADEFSGKIVVIGSTAPSLFDIKPTSVARNHPGVEIMMTAIDNLKNADYLTELPQALYIAITAVAIVLLAVAFLYNVDWLWLRTLFTMMQVAFLAITYLFLNYTTWFVNLTAPFTAAFAYFLVATFYSRTLMLRRNGHPWYSAALDPGRESQVLLLSCHLVAAQPKQRRRINAILQRQAGRTHYGATASRLFGAAPLMQNIYEDTLLFYWLVPPERTCAALRDLIGMLEPTLARLRARGLDTGVQLVLHAVRFTVDAQGQWQSEGKNAFMTVLDLARHPMRGHLARTDAFADLCAACPDVPIPAALVRAGLYCERESAPG